MKSSGWAGELSHGTAWPSRRALLWGDAMEASSRTLSDLWPYISGEYCQLVMEKEKERGEGGFAERGGMREEREREVRQRQRSLPANI